MTWFDSIAKWFAAGAAKLKPAKRGRVLGLALEEVRQRALYLASDRCVTGYYRLNGEHDGLPAYNGGKDPTAADPFDRWSKPGSKFVNITADCIGGAAWCGGFDRYQPKRFAHIYDGWINTDSMLMDARGPAKCFVELPYPAPGCFVVCASGTPGHAVGHIGVVVEVPPNFNASKRESWAALIVVDVASTGAGNRANTRRTGRGWYGTGAGFVRSVMQP